MFTETFYQGLLIGIGAGIVVTLLLIFMCFRLWNVIIYSGNKEINITLNDTGKGATNEQFEH